MLYRYGREFFSRHPHLMAGTVGSIARRVPLSIRHGYEYRRIRRLLERSQWWSREEFAQYQLDQLRQTLERAYRLSPYYREKFDRAGVAPADLRSLEDIRLFPTLSKDELRDNIDRMISPDVDRRKLMNFCTGGTTGPGVVIPFEEKYRNRCRGFVWHLWERIGYQPKHLAALLQHRECPPDINDGIWYMEKPSNAMVLSAHRLSPKTIPAYLQAIKAHKPRVLIAYPSLAYLFASYAKAAGWNEKLFELVILGSETLYEFQRRELEAFFQAPVRIHYAHIESCALFGYCETSNVYHVQMEYGLSEFLREDGSPAGPGEVGEIVATNFENHALPLVRYKTGDLAEPAEGRCACGRDYPLVEKIHGRKADLIHTPSGAAHSPILIEFLMDKLLLAGQDHFADLQVVQPAVDKIVVRVVPGNVFVREDVESFCRLLDEELNHEIQISIDLVDEIPRTERQKKCLVVSEVR
jgi:phenylacetate-CoA ligase